MTEEQFIKIEATAVCERYSEDFNSVIAALVSEGYSVDATAFNTASDEYTFCAILTRVVK